jgi:hypothetical protein
MADFKRARFSATEPIVDLPKARNTSLTAASYKTTGKQVSTSNS